MPQNPDIAFAITETLASGELVVVSELLPDHGAVRESTAHIMVQGDISGSAALETRGSIMGNLATPCCIQAGGDVIVVGSALNARISARSILIGGETRDCQLGTLGSATIFHNLANSEITLGDLGPNQPLIQNATSALTQLIEHRDILTRQIGHTATALHAMSKTPRCELNLNVGKIIRHGKDGIVIDLSQFYQHLQKDIGQNVDLALGEFFNKGVLGVISRVNRAYFTANPAHERVFIKLIRQLRGLVNLVRQRDLLQERIDDEREQSGRLTDQCTDPHRLLEVRGQIYPEVLVRYNRPDIELGEIGHFQIKNRPVDLVISHGADPGVYRIQRHRHAHTMAVKDLHCVTCKLDADEQIEIAHLDSEPGATTQTPSHRNSPILVVEDALKMRNFIVASLAAVGFDRIEAAADGEAGLALFERAPTDLVLLEWDRIGTKGLDDMRALQKAAIPDDLAIIAIASRNSAESVSSATREGAADVLLKPFTAAELIDKVEAVLAGKAERT